MVKDFYEEDPEITAMTREEVVEYRKKNFNIIVELFKKDDFIHLIVKDNGIGWPEIVKKYAGKPFVTTKENGVGLGLYNGFTFASAVGGKLILSDNINGVGACAQFQIPIYKEGA